MMTTGSGRTGLERATVVLDNGTVALDEVTLLAEPGELLAVLGPSGSGKSTILRAIAGLQHVSSGRVLIDGEPASELAKRDVGMVFQDSALIPFMDAAHNMAFPLDLAHTPKEQSRRRVDDQARRLGLGGVLRRKPKSMSPGENARVGFGRAMIRQPRAFLLDEPFAHLDAAERSRMRQELRTLVRQTGVTTFFVTHDQIDALSISDRVAVIAGGQLLQVGPGRQLYEAPVSLDVAEMVAPGRIGILPAEFVVADAMTGYRIGERTLPTWAAAPDHLSGDHGRDVLLGVRPEDVHETPRADDGTVTGRVRAVELVGSHVNVQIMVGPREIHARFDRRTKVGVGDEVTVGVDAARALVFDASTRRLISAPPGTVLRPAPGDQPTA